MSPNEQQAEAWNGSESIYFVEKADRYDLQLEPFTRALFECATPRTHEVVLDVGSGSGATTLEAAHKAARATGVDLSRPLVELAQRRTEAAGIKNADFIIADAQTHEFVAGAYDLLISQFGLMFFDDPVRALSNLCGALRPGGRIVFVCWQGLHANEWLRLIADAVGRHVEVPEFGRQARGPGMFALCDVGEITALLGTAGFEDVDCRSCTPTILIGGGGNLAESTEFLLGMGMAQGLLGLVESSVRGDVVQAVTSDLNEKYEEGKGLRLGAAAWVVSAKTGQRGAN